MTDCYSYRPARGDKPCIEEPKFEVVYLHKGKIVDRHDACFAHGVAEVDRHFAAGGFTHAELRPKAAA